MNRQGNGARDQLVVLVDSENQPIGTARRSEVHHEFTPLHRGFSVFLFDSEQKVLLQRRSEKKRTWPLVWSNSCCGHPMPGESSLEAARRRLRDELGIEAVDLQEIFPDYRYRAERNGIVENEICSVLLAVSEETPSVDPDEVNAIRWVSWETFMSELIETPDGFTPWCREEALLLTEQADFRGRLGL